MIHVAFALHDYLGSYSMYTGTAMASLFENTREPVTVHLLHNDTLSPQNRERFIQLCASYGQNIGFYRVSAEQDFDIAAIEKRGYCEGIMFRLYLPRLLPAAVEKIIYLDSDLLINMDIRELFQKITTFFPDQDLLNVVFQDDVRYMDRKYNWFLIRNHNQPLGEKIYHYNAAVFNFSNQLLNFAGLYFDYWDKTLWRDAALGADHKMHLLIRMHSGLTYLQRKMDKGMVLTPQEELDYGQELHRAGEYEKCRDYLITRLNVEQNNEILASKLYMLSAAYEALGQSREQKDALLISLRYDTPYVFSCFKLGMLCFQEKHYRQARFWLETSLHAKQNLQQIDVQALKYRTYQKLSKCCLKLNDIDAAIRYNDLAGEIRPDSLSVAINQEVFKQLRPEQGRYGGGSFA